MEEKVVDLYCSRDLFHLNLIATHLKEANIEYHIFGDTATSVLGIDNPTQMACIRVFESDLEKSKTLIAEHIKER